MDLREHTGIYYLHLPKCGGTYIENLLGGHLKRHGKFYQHGGHQNMHPARNSGWYGKVLPIASVRNPFDLLVSIYFHGGDQGVDNCGGFGYVNRVMGFKSFEEFVIYYCENGDYSKVEHLLPLKDEFLFKPLFDNDNLIPDYVIKMESIDQGCDQLLDGFGIITTNRKFDRNISHYRPKGSEGNYTNFYTTKLKEMVEERIKKDLELFNYSFDVDSNSPLLTKKEIMSNYWRLSEGGLPK